MKSNIVPEKGGGESDYSISNSKPVDEANTQYPISNKKSAKSEYPTSNKKPAEI